MGDVDALLQLTQPGIKHQADRRRRDVRWRPVLTTGTPLIVSVTLWRPVFVARHLRIVTTAAQPLGQHLDMVFNAAKHGEVVF